MNNIEYFVKIFLESTVSFFSFLQVNKQLVQIDGMFFVLCWYFLQGNVADRCPIVPADRMADCIVFILLIIFRLFAGDAVCSGHDFDRQVALVVADFRLQRNDGQQLLLLRRR